MPPSFVNCHFVLARESWMKLILMFWNILDKKHQSNEVGLAPEPQRKQNLNPFLNSTDEEDIELDGGELRCSQADYSNKNPFEIESELDRLNPFVDGCERGDNVDQGDTAGTSLTSSQRSLKEEITISNYNDSFEVTFTLAHTFH